MSDQRQNNAGGSTLYGAPLPELEQDSSAREPNMDDGVSNPPGFVVPTQESEGEEVYNGPRGASTSRETSDNPNISAATSSTDVQLLFKVFGGEEKKSGQPSEPLSHIIKEYESKQPPRKRAVPPPIPPAARKKPAATPIAIPDFDVVPTPPSAEPEEERTEQVDPKDVTSQESFDSMGEETLPPKEFDTPEEEPSQDAASLAEETSNINGFGYDEDSDVTAITQIARETPPPATRSLRHTSPLTPEPSDLPEETSRAPFHTDSAVSEGYLSDDELPSFERPYASSAEPKDYHSFSHDQRIGTGTVAFMPRSDVLTDDALEEELEEAINDQDFGEEGLHPSIEDVDALNSEFLRVSPPSEAGEEIDLSDLNIPSDANGYPLARIFRSRFTPRSKLDSSSSYHHLSSAGLYDNSSVKFLREEISEKGYSFSGTAQVSEPIDVNLAASLEIAYSADQQAAMRTASIIASVIQKKPTQIEVLTKHFPGPTFVDPFELPFDDVEPVSKHGPVLLALSKLQMLGVNFLVRFLHHHDKLRRFYAMMLINEIVPQSSAKILVDLISDEDSDIRVHASSILLKRRSQPSFDEQVLTPLRHILSSEATDSKVLFTARFLALVLDAKSVPIAIQLLERDPSPSQRNAALDLLHSVTLQRYQTIEEWEKWAKGRDFNSRFARLYWLIDALNDPSLAVREDAYQQLNPTFKDHLKEYLPTYPEAVRRRVQSNLRVQFQKK